MSKDEVEKLRKEAELHAAEDAIRKETVEADLSATKYKPDVPTTHTGSTVSPFPYCF